MILTFEVEVLDEEGIEFFVPGMPAPQGSKKAFLNKRTGRPVMVEDNTSRHRTWRSAVSAEAQDEAARLRGVGRLALLDGPLLVNATFRMGARTKSNPLRKYPDVAPDLSKLIRALEDSLSGVLIRDDARIVRLVIGKDYGEPGCQLAIYRMPAKIEAPAKVRRPAVVAEQGALL